MMSRRPPRSLSPANISQGLRRPVRRHATKRSARQGAARGVDWSRSACAAACATRTASSWRAGASACTCRLTRCACCRSGRCSAATCWASSASSRAFSASGFAMIHASRRRRQAPRCHRCASHRRCQAVLLPPRLTLPPLRHVGSGPKPPSLPSATPTGGPVRAPQREDLAAAQRFQPDACNCYSAA